MMRRIIMLRTVSHVLGKHGRYVNYYQGQEYVADTEPTLALATEWVSRRLADWVEEPKRSKPPRMPTDRVNDGN